MVTTFYPPYHFGGEAVFVRRLAHALARHGHRVDVIHDADAYGVLGAGAELAPLEEPDGVQVHRLRSHFGALSCLLTHQTGRPIVHGRRIRRILDGGDYDVIHFHNVSLVGGPGILAYGQALKLYTAHEYWLVCPTSMLWRHNREICTQKQCFRCPLHYNRPPQLWRWTSLLESQLPHIDAFLTPSAFAAAKHAELGFSRTMEVLPNFLPDAEPEDTATAPRSEGVAAAPYFLFVGRLKMYKGLQDVIPLFGEGAPADLLIAGTGAGTGNYEPELRRLAARLPRVRFLGRLTSSELRRYYADAIAIVVPPIHFEIAPLVVVEAFREGTPVIARRCGPFPEIIETSGGGLLFDTEAELRASLHRLAGDPGLRARLGEAGRQAHQALWSETAILPRYLALIKQVALKRGFDDLADAISSPVRADT
jgi:glycosyltransferase involved in cell wall biosynthesis